MTWRIGDGQYCCSFLFAFNRYFHQFQFIIYFIFYSQKMHILQKILLECLVTHKHHGHKCAPVDVRSHVASASELSFDSIPCNHFSILGSEYVIQSRWNWLHNQIARRTKTKLCYVFFFVLLSLQCSFAPAACFFFSLRWTSHKHLLISYMQWRLENMI